MDEWDNEEFSHIASERLGCFGCENGSPMETVISLPVLAFQQMPILATFRIQSSVLFSECKISENVIPAMLYH